MMRDLQRVMDLQARGDDPARERLIEHLILDVAEADRDSLARELQAMGYAFAGPEGEMIRFTVHGRTDMASVRQRTESLIRLCQAFDCHYEGWSAPVVN
jgi:regulator of RNase E activity RraB